MLCCKDLRIRTFSNPDIEPWFFQLRNHLCPKDFSLRHEDILPIRLSTAFLLSIWWPGGLIEIRNMPSRKDSQRYATFTKREFSVKCYEQTRVKIGRLWLILCLLPEGHFPSPLGSRIRFLFSGKSVLHRTNFNIYEWQCKRKFAANAVSIKNRSIDSVILIYPPYPWCGVDLLWPRKTWSMSLKSRAEKPARTALCFRCHKRVQWLWSMIVSWTMYCLATFVQIKEEIVH